MRSKLLLIMFISICILSFILLFKLHYSTEKEVEGKFQTRQLFTTRHLARDIESWLQTEAQSLKELTLLEPISNLNPLLMEAKVEEYYTYLKKDHLKSIIVYDKNGKVLYSTKEEGDSSKSFLVNITEKVISTSGGKNEAGSVTFVLDLMPMLNSFITLDNSGSIKERLWLLNNDGTLLFQQDHPEMVNKNIFKNDKSCFECHNDFNYAKTILSNVSGTTEYRLKNYPNKLSSYAAINYDQISWKIVVNVPLDEVSTFNNENLYQSIFLFVIIVIALLGASYLVSRSNRMKIMAIEEAKHLREKRELEIKLGESESHYKTIVENSPSPIFIHCEGKIVYVNPAGISAYGVSEARDILGKPVFDLVHPDDREKIKQRVTEMISSGSPASIMEERFISNDGRVIYGEVTPVPLMFQNKNAILAIVNDITDRKRLELERQTIYDITLGVLSASSLNDLLKFIHQSLTKVLYGENCFVALYDQDTALFSFPYFVDKYDPIPEPLALKKSCTAYVFRTGKPLLLTQELFQQLKESNEAELVGSPSPSWVGIPLQTKDRIIGVLVLQHYEATNAYSERDVKFLSTIGNEIAVVVERKLAEEDRIRAGQEIKKRNEELASINIVKDKFFSIIAHDLKSPFNGFIGMTGIIVKEGEEYSREELINYNKVIHESATNLYKLIENLLEWAQMQKGSIRFEPDNCSLFDITAQNIALLNDKALQKGIVVSNDIQDDYIVYGDRKMLDTILRNLLSNAIKFTRRTGRVIVGAKYTEDKMIEVSVKDTGVGISEANIKRLFKMEEKVSSQGTEGESSTGLGLLLCKEFVEKHNGRIRAESIEGEGSSFYFTIQCGNNH